jgi:hypothetical protein
MKKLPILDYEDSYEISNEGEVYSKERVVQGIDGTLYPFEAKKRVQHQNKNVEYMTVDLWKNNKGKKFYVHRIVATAFIPNPENKPEVNHIDGNRQNNNVNNLEWCTRLENIQHAIKTGLRVYVNRLTRDEFIQCLQDVIEGESYLSLSERVPYKVPYLSTKIRQIAQEEKLEHLLDESLAKQRRIRARKNGSQNRKNGNKHI